MQKPIHNKEHLFFIIKPEFSKFNLKQIAADEIS